METRTDLKLSNEFDVVVGNVTLRHRPQDRFFELLVDGVKQENVLDVDISIHMNQTPIISIKRIIK